MHKPYKKITASLLLFSHMLTSCYNPNIGMGKQALPTPADPAYKQGQYAGEPHDKYREQLTNLIFTTADKHPVRFTYLNGQWQAEVEEHASNGSWQRRQLPVVFEPGLTIEDVVNSNPTEQKLLHICASEEDLEKPGYVYVGRAPIQAKPHPQLLSSPAARQITPLSEVGLAQQQATTQPQQGETSPQQAQEQPGQQALLALPSPVQQIGEGPRSQDQLPTTPARATSKSLSTPSRETPRQRVAQNHPTSTQQTPSRRAFSWRNQHELLHSQRAAQAKRAQSAAMARPGNQLAHPAQPRPAIIPPPSLAHKAPEGIASQALLAQGGHPVRFMHQDGQWWASVRERIGAFYRVRVLPVACERHGDIAKALADLQAKPTQYTQRRIHVMHTQQIPYVPQFVYLGAQGLRGGGNGAGGPSGSGEPQGEPATGEPEGAQGREASQSLIASQDREASLVALQARMAQGDITSTQGLVEAFNAAQAPEEQEALQQWIQRYIAWFNEQTQHVGNLALIPEEIQEYTCLAHIQADRPANSQLLASYFNSLCNKIDKEYQHGEEPLIQALEYTLQNMDSRVFEGDPSKLIKLGNDLLAKLDPDSNQFTKATYPTHRSTLYALHQALVLIQQIDSDWDPTQKEGLYSRFKAQIADLKQNAQYYPICYHARLLKQSLQRLESAKDLPEDIRRRVGHGFKAVFYLWQGAPIPIYFKPNLDKLLEGFKELKTALGRQGIKAKPWYDSLLKLSNATLLTLKDPNQYEDFEEQLQGLKDKGGIRKEKDRTALRFGIVQQLCMLSLHGPTAEVRKQSMEQLQALTNSWSEDAEVMAGLLDGLAALTIQSQGAEKEAAEAALASLTLTDSPLRPARRRFLPLSSDRRKAAALASITEQWLDGQTLADKLSGMAASGTTPASGGLFSAIKSTLIKEAQKAPHSLAATQEARQALKEYYQHLDFAQVKSLFEGEAPKHVDSLQCQLMLIEQVKKKDDREGQQDQLSTHHERLEWVKTPIALEELFKKRSTKPDEPEREIQKVLLVGEPGTGKTMLSRRLAYRWTQGDWGKEFNAVYVLPVRALQKSEYDNGSFRKEATLATAIANHCFPPREEDAYKRLRYQISEELKQPTTLVVLDGLDEGAGASESLLREAKAGRHKLLLLSRPYGIEQERTMVDIEIAHAGLSDGQMQDYVRDNSSPELGEALLQFIKEYPAIGAIAHVPVNLQILCALWKDKGAGVRAETSNGSLPGLYRMLTEYIWERYARKRDLQNKDCEELFDTLGKIALEAFEQGQVLISPELVRDHVEVARVGKMLQDMKDAGFLLLQSVGSQYQFPHLTFQEYFAGRALARQLFSSEAKVRAKAQKFFTKHQYAPQYERMLSFLAGEVSKAQEKKGIKGIRQVLSLLEKEPKEVVGVQHMLLQMRLLNEWLCVAGKKRKEGLDRLEEEFHVMASLEEWFGEGLDRVRRGDDNSWDDRKLLSLLTTELQRSRAVAAHALAVLQPLIAACKDEDKDVRLAASQALGQIVQAAPAHTLAVLPPLIGACKNDHWNVRLAASQALGQVVQAAPAEQILQPLIAACKDDHWNVRLAASEALGQVVQAAPAHALAVLPPLIAACKDDHWNVRLAANQVLGQVVQAAPAEQVLQPLIAACKDDHWNVRLAARSALGQVVQAAPAEQVLQPLIAACKDSDASVRRAASQALRQVVQAAPAEQVLQPLIAACKDSDDDVRRAASQALGQVGEAASAEQVPQPLIAACKDEDVRRAARSALGQVVHAAPAHALAVLQPLIAACKDSDADVRRAARSALGQVVQAAPAEQVLQPLIAACKDDHWNVRLAASQALGQIVQAAPAHALAVLQPLIAACKDSDASARRAARSALGQVVQAAPAEQVLQPLIAACKDLDSEVRLAASQALRKFSLQQFMEGYWATQNQALIPLIAPRLYHTPLSVQSIPHAQDQRLILYPTAGQRVEWKKPHQEVQHFVQQIKRAAKQKQ